MCLRKVSKFGIFTCVVLSQLFVSSHSFAGGRCKRLFTKKVQAEATNVTRKSGVVILAAGKGSRMNSDTPKVLHEIQGKPMLFYILDAIHAADPEVPVAIVVGFAREKVEEKVKTAFENFKRMKIDFVEQTEQNGTGHAARCAMDSEWGEARVNEGAAVLVLPGDLPLITAKMISDMIEPLNSGEAIRMLTTVIENPKGYGRIVRDPNTGSVQRIVEEKDATLEEKKINEVAVSTYTFDSAFLRAGLHGLSTNNTQGEYYLTDLIGAAVHEQRMVSVQIWGNASDLRGVNDCNELAQATELMLLRSKQ